MSKIFNLDEKISSSVRSVSAYTPGEQPKDGGWVKLNTNEFPYPPSPSVRDAIIAELGSDAATLRLYPDPMSSRLRSAIAEHFGVPSEYVQAGNGSDDTLNLAVRAFADSEKFVATLDPSYSLYPVLSKIQGTKLINIGFENGVEINFQKVFGCGANIFFFTNPNAPTGKGFGAETVEKLAEGFDGIVLVDEAYAPFSEFSAAKLALKYDNLIVTGTCSKGWGLAGMRVGWAIANPATIEVLDRVRDSYNLDRLAQAAGVAAMRDNKYHIDTCAKVKKSRAETEAFFDELGWKYIKSSANFILFTPNKSGEENPSVAADLLKFLRERKILLRYFASDPTVNSSIRLTVGTAEQMATFMSAAREWKNSK